MVKPPSYPPTSPLSLGFPSTSIHEKGNVSAEQTSRIRHSTPPGISVFASASSAVRCDFFAPRDCQTTLDATWYRDKFKEDRKAVGNFWYYYDIPFNVVNSQYWDCMVAAIAACGPKFKAPNNHELQGPVLDETVTNIMKVVKEQRKI